MHRRQILQHIAAAGAVAGATGAGLQARAQSEAQTTNASIQWQMATSWPQPQSITFKSIEAFCQQVSAMTNGEFVITPYAADQLAPALEVFSVVQSGEVACGHTPSYYYLDRHPALVFGTSLPFGLTPYQQYTWLYYGGGLDALQKLHQPLGLVAFPAGNSGVQMGGWFNQEVNTVADFDGLKMRIPGFGARIMERLGAKSFLLGGDQIYDALASGQIDAAEWQNPHEDLQLGLHEIAKYCYYPSWWEPGSTYEIVINWERWEQLPRVYQQIVRAAAAEVNLTMLASFDANNGQALQALVDQGVQLRAYSPEILSAAHRATFEYLEELAAQNVDFWALYERWKVFRRQIFAWNRINELSFNQFSIQG